MTSYLRAFVFLFSLALASVPAFGQQCQGGPLDGQGCATDQDCYACNGGISNGTNCAGDPDCAGLCDLDALPCVNDFECQANDCLDPSFCDQAASCFDSAFCASIQNGSTCQGGGPFEGLGCETDSDCWACDSGRSFGAECTTDVECWFCSGGFNESFPCEGDIDCAGQCFIGANPCLEPVDCTANACNGQGVCDLTPVCIELPVELVSFAARVDGLNVLLIWETASETNNAGFEIEGKGERSESKGEWQSLAFIEGAGTTDIAQTYRYRALNLAPGTWSFRLKQVDFDGAFEYSETVEATVALPVEYVLEPAYPNPFNPSATIRFAIASEQVVRVVLMDMLGREVRVLYEGVPEANTSNEVRITGEGLATGSYLVSVQGERFVATRDVVYVK